MSIYKRTIKAVQDGAKFSVNFEKRNLIVNKKTIIKNGEYKGWLGVRKRRNYLEHIEELFAAYQRSIPSERSESHKRMYFRAKEYDQISDMDMICGEQREVARARLEVYLLCLIIKGRFKWDDDTMGKWFWKSKRFPELVILKKWVVKDSDK